MHENIQILAEIIYYADLYGIMNIVSKKVERQLINIEDLEIGVKWNPMFFLFVGYYLHSEVLFTQAFMNVVGTDMLDCTNVTVPTDIILTERELRIRLVKGLSGFVQDVSRVLAFEKKKERLYDSRGRKHLPRYGNLSSTQSKIREVAKKAIMNWFTTNILMYIDFSEPMRMCTQDWILFCDAVEARDYSMLEPGGVKSLAARSGLDAPSIEEALKEELKRLDQTIPMKSRIIDEEDEQRFKVDFSTWQGYESWYLPWRHRLYELGVQEERRDIEEFVTKPAEKEYLDLMGLEPPERVEELPLPPRSPSPPPSDQEEMGDERAGW
jgi:hypothetical protein